jgi:PPOX class probable F420-dependent enzyme
MILTNHYVEGTFMNQIPDSHRDLLTADTGILSTIGPDDVPQVTALWFLYDDDGLVRLSLSPERQKTKNLRRNPECTFFILDCENRLRTLEIRARAEIASDADYTFAGKLGQKYGADLRQIDPPGLQRVMVRLRPIKVVATDMSRAS